MDPSSILTTITMASVPLLVSLLLLFFPIMVVIIKKSLEKKKPFEGIPMPPVSHWLFGHLDMFRRFFLHSEFQPCILDHCNENGQIGLWIGPRKALLVTQAKDARTILSAEYFRSTPHFVRAHVTKLLGAKNIGLLQGREWKLHRSIIYRSMTPKAVAQYTQAMGEVVDTFVSNLSQKIQDSKTKDNSDGVMTMDVESLMKMITMDIFAKSALSTDLGCCQTLSASPIAKAFDFLLREFNERLSQPWNPSNFFYSLPTQRNRRHQQERTLLRAFLTDLISSRTQDMTTMTKKELANCGTATMMKGAKPDEYQDLLSNLIAMHQEQSSSKANGHRSKVEISDEMLHDTIMALLFAGYDTTSITLTYALYCIATNPQVRQRCLEEILSNETASSSSSCGDPEDLVYCRAVLYETLRLYPPAGMTVRVLLKPVVLQGEFTVPSGTRVFIPIDLIQRSDRHYPDANSFHPERWLELPPPKNNGAETVGHQWKESSDANREAFLAFSAGGRSCPGQRFALQEAVLVLSSLLKAFDFDCVDGYVLKPSRVGIVQHPEGGLPMTIKLRVKNKDE